MRARLLLIAAIAAAGCVVTASAAAQAPAAVRPGVGPERPFQLAPRVERTLENGLRIIVTRQTAVPKVAATLTVMAGLSSDPSGRPGLAAMTADAIQEGTKNRTSREIRRQAFGMGGSLTAAASQDFTSIEVRGLAEFTDGLLDLLADVAMSPTFPEEEIAILRQQRLQALAQQKGSPQFLSNREFRHALFGAHPYARVTSTPEALAAIDRTAIGSFHQGHYRPNNAFLLVVGAVEPEQVFAAAGKAFGPWARGDAPKTTFAAAPSLAGRRVVFVQRPNSVQSSISVGNLALKRSDPRWFDLNLTNAIFGGAFNSRIVRNIREEKGYTYSPSSQFAAFADAGFYRFAADVRNEVTGPTLTEVFREIEKMREAGSDGAELEGAKQYLRGLFAIQTATQAGLSAVLNNVYVFGLPKDYPETYRAKVAAVTPAQIKAAAATLLQSTDSVVVIVGDYDQVKGQLASFKDITLVDVDGRRLDPAPASRP